MNTPLKHIDLTQTSFTANGREYLVEKELSVDRFIEFEKLQNELGWGMEFRYLFNKVSDAYSKLNSGKVADAAVILANLKDGIVANIEKRTHPALMLCTLFMNQRDEDRRYWSKDLGEQKIKDWVEEGYDVKDFFHLAVNLVQDFIPIFKEISQSTSEKKKDKKNTTGKE